jgi:hypothetical protein
MRNLILFSFLMLFCFSTYCQIKTGLGLNYVNLDAPDDIFLSPNLNFEKKTLKRTFINAQIGYGIIKRFDRLSKKIPENRFRFMVNLGGSYALIKHKDNYLKIGGGPSIWYRKESIVDQIKFDLTNQSNVLEYKYREFNEINLGYNLFSQIDISILKKISLNGTFGFVSFKKAGASPILGISAMYSLN